MDPAASAAQELLKLGVPGAVIIFLGIALYTVWKSNTELVNQLTKLQEARLDDVRRCTEALVTAAASMEKQADTMAGIQATLTSLMAEWAVRRRP